MQITGQQNWERDINALPDAFKSLGRFAILVLGGYSLITAVGTKLTEPNTNPQTQPQPAPIMFDSSSSLDSIIQERNIQNPDSVIHSPSASAGYMLARMVLRDGVPAVDLIYDSLPYTTSSQSNRQ